MIEEHKIIKHWSDGKLWFLTPHLMKIAAWLRAVSPVVILTFTITGSQTMENKPYTRGHGIRFNSR